MTYHGFYIGPGNFALNHNRLVVYAKGWLWLRWLRWLNLNDWNAKWCVGTNFFFNKIKLLNNNYYVNNFFQIFDVSLQCIGCTTWNYFLKSNYKQVQNIDTQQHYLISFLFFFQITLDKSPQLWIIYEYFLYYWFFPHINTIIFNHVSHDNKMSKLSLNLHYLGNISLVVKQ